MAQILSRTVRIYNTLCPNNYRREWPQVFTTRRPDLTTDSILQHFPQTLLCRSFGGSLWSSRQIPTVDRSFRPLHAAWINWPGLSVENASGRRSWTRTPHLTARFQSVPQMTVRSGLFFVNYSINLSWIIRTRLQISVPHIPPTPSKSVRLFQSTPYIVPIKHNDVPSIRQRRSRYQRQDRGSVQHLFRGPFRRSVVRESAVHPPFARGGDENRAGGTHCPRGFHSLLGKPQRPCCHGWLRPRRRHRGYHWKGNRRSSHPVVQERRRC